MNKYSKKISRVLILMILLSLIVGCTKTDDSKKRLVIADQYGLGYAPIQVMKAKGFLEANLPNYEIEWVKMGNASAIREAMITGDLDIGFMGIPPFLIGVDNDTPWRIFTGLSEAPLGLVSKSQQIKTLEDISKNDQIILPQPGSIQHILLQMAAKKKFDDAKKFDNQLLTMNHSDGLSALSAENELNLHFTSPPYIFKALAFENTRLVVDGKEAFGGSFTFIVGVSQEEFFNDKEAYNAFMKSLNESLDFINNNKEETLETLNEIYDFSKKDLNTYIYNKETVYSKNIQGVETFSQFMYDEKMLDQVLKIDDLIWKAEEDLD